MANNIKPLILFVFTIPFIVIAIIFLNVGLNPTTNSILFNSTNPNLMNFTTKNIQNFTTEIVVGNYTVNHTVDGSVVDNSVKTGVAFIPIPLNRILTLDLFFSNCNNGFESSSGTITFYDTPIANQLLAVNSYNTIVCTAFVPNATILHFIINTNMTNTTSFIKFEFSGDVNYYTEFNVDNNYPQFSFYFGNPLIADNSSEAIDFNMTVQNVSQTTTYEYQTNLTAFQFLSTPNGFDSLVGLSLVSITVIALVGALIVKVL